MAKIDLNPPELSEQDIERFWKKVDKSLGQGPKGDCWRFLQSKKQKYCTFKVKDRQFLSHRIAFFLATGKWTAEYVCHHCDWRPCCNPSHLFPDTPLGNITDAVRKGRMATGIRHGRSTHPEATPRGEQSPKAKLSTVEVLEIRQRGQLGESQRKLAKAFGVTQANISIILRRESWNHI